jgi:branched-chain amino acid transport system substrate-binding protein
MIATLSALTVFGLAGTVGASAATGGAPIKIGLIMSETGVASSTYSGGQYGAIARINAQNAQGGVNGHKIQLVVQDDGSNPSNNKLVAQDLVQNKGVFGLINYSSFTYAAAEWMQQNGIPVAGFGIDGPEWGQQPYTNMFDAIAPSSTPFNGVYYDFDGGIASFLKTLGVTKMAGLAYGISPSAQLATEELLTALNQVGIKTCYNDTSVPFGAADFTAQVLSMKSAGCNGVNGAFVDSSNIALSEAVKQGGIQAVQIYYTGYDQTTLDSPSAISALQGDYFGGTIYNHPTGGIATMLDRLVKYDPQYKRGDLPSFGAVGSYLAADVMIKGLEVAGKNPTRRAFINNLRKVCSYDVAGLPNLTVTFCHFATVDMLPKQTCGAYVQLKGNHFVPALGGRQFCGKRQAYKPT